MRRVKAVITAEGSYPFETGGVSVWADLLVHELKHIDFHIMAIMMHPFAKLKYELPENVIKLHMVPLWGSEEPTEFIRDVSFATIYREKLKSSTSEAPKKFINTMYTLMDYFFQKKNDMEELGDTLYDFYEYFHEYDYYTIFHAEEVWEAYKSRYLEFYKTYGGEKKPTVFDMIEGLRFIYRFFISMLAKVEPADIYHSSAAAFCALPCIIAKKKYGSKFLLTEHGVYVREQYLYASREKMPLFTKHFLLGMITTASRLSYHFADTIAPVCAYNERWETRWGAMPEKIDVIYNGIDTERFRNLQLPPNERPTVVMVARVDPLKDIETYIRTCDLVSKDIPDVLFKLYGPEVDKKYAKVCRDLVDSLGLQKNFSFEGSTSNPAEAYNEGDVVMLTSISEAFPFVVIEAMACERVVVSSDVGGTKEVLEGYGFVIKPKDYKGFADSVIRVLKDPDLKREMGIEAREHILNGFTIEDMVENYDKLYERLDDERYEAKRAIAVPA